MAKVEYSKTKYKNIYTWRDTQSSGSKTHYRYDITHNHVRYQGSYDTIEEAKKALLMCCVNNNIPIKNYKKL